MPSAVGNLEWNWNSTNGHIVSMQRTGDEITVQDPQSGKTYRNLNEFLEHLINFNARLNTTKLLRIDGLAFNMELCNNILTKGKKK